MSVLDVSQFNDQKLARTRIPRVAIVGTGFVGSTTAYALLLSRTPAEIVLIDRDERRADGHMSRICEMPKCFLTQRESSPASSMIVVRQT